MAPLTILQMAQGSAELVVHYTFADNYRVFISIFSKVGNYFRLSGREDVLDFFLNLLSGAVALMSFFTNIIIIIARLLLLLLQKFVGFLQYWVIIEVVCFPEILFTAEACCVVNLRLFYLRKSEADITFFAD